MSKVDLSFRVYRQLSEKLRDEDLTKVYERAEECCRDCKPLSPTTCIERCYVWKLKNELLEIFNISRGKEYAIHLFNAIKNERRLKILEILSVQSCNVKELQQCLKKEGYYHSCSTIRNSYVMPLVNTALVKEENGIYKLTLYGKKIHDILSKRTFKDLFPAHSGCYEESCLRALTNGPKSYDELTRSLSKRDLHRTIERLEKKGLVTRNHPAAHVLFFATRKESIEKLSPTERRVFDIISKTDGTSVHEISNKVRITLRRAYKYLNKLKEKKLVLHQRKTTMYKLTPKGEEVVDSLESMLLRWLRRKDIYNGVITNCERERALAWSPQIIQAKPLN